MIARARERGWMVEASPHLALRNSAPGQRLYMRPAIDAAECTRRWEEGDLSRVGQYPGHEIYATLWPWLKDRAYAEAADDAALDEFVSTQLGNRPAFLRPGLRFKRRWSAVEARGRFESLHRRPPRGRQRDLGRSARTTPPWRARGGKHVDSILSAWLHRRPHRASALDDLQGADAQRSVAAGAAGA
jgi:hypothetical protein